MLDQVVFSPKAVLAPAELAVRTGEFWHFLAKGKNVSVQDIYTCRPDATDASKWVVLVMVGVQFKIYVVLE